MTTTTAPTTTRPALPRPPAPPVAAPKQGVQFSKPSTKSGHRVCLYGPGGIGKTTLASKLTGNTVFFDLDESLSKLGIDAPVVNVVSWQQLRDALQADGWDGVNNIVIDTTTKAEEMAVAHTLANVLMDGGKKATSIESYGFGKGYTHVFDTFLQLLGDLDKHVRAGRNVVLICHDCTNVVPNPTGEDWIRFEPRLQSPSSGKASIRLRVREWADHVLFIGYDVSVKDGVGTGKGTRTIYSQELPHCMAKSRTTQEQFALGTDGADVWENIIK